MLFSPPLISESVDQIKSETTVTISMFVYQQFGGTQKFKCHPTTITAAQVSIH